MDQTRDFYDALAPDYDLIFADWDATVRGQGAWLDELIGDPGARVLDIACGMGTQAIGLRLHGHDVVARDLSPALVARARAEARRFGIELAAEVGDMRDARPGDAGRFDAVVAFDNALPHLDSEADLARALAAARAALAPGGVFLASVRDYDRLLEERPRWEPPRLLGEGDAERIVMQLWAWRDERRYDFELLILVRDPEHGWRPRVRRATYRGVRRAELAKLAAAAGLCDLEWLEPADSGFYQPILRARAPRS